MKISKLIKKLIAVRNKYGEIDVCASGFTGINRTHEAFEINLPKPLGGSINGNGHLSIGLNKKVKK